MKSLNIPKIASFKKETSISNLEKINLFFGYNGSGKTTISRVLKNDFGAIVYNEDFIEENFRNVDKQKGIFTIGKDAGDAKDKIKEANNTKNELQNQIDNLIGNADKNIEGQKPQKENELKSSWNTIVEKLWNIKKDTDTIPLFNCIEGLRRDSIKLANAFIKYSTDERRVEISITDGRFWKDLESRGNIVFNYSLEKKATLKLSLIKHYEQIISNPIWLKQIKGNKDNCLTQLIEELKNSDWVNQGRVFLNEKGLCPFCQEPLKKQFLNDLNLYFDELYEKDKVTLRELSNEYEFSDFISTLKTHLNEEFSKGSSLELKIIEFENLLNENSRLIAEKINNPSKSIELKSLRAKFKELSIVVGSINREILAYNRKIDKRGDEKKQLNKDFWDYYTAFYKEDISNYLLKKTQIENELKQYSENVELLKKSIVEQDRIIAENQAKLTDIYTSINSINISLIKNGFSSFKLKKWGEDSCRIVRNGSVDENNIYMSLSEGEKTIISFLYFTELCKGTTDKGKEISTNRLIVIDDPISSLSHNIVFEVAQIVRSDFLTSTKQNNYNQLFILTHNLYLFYEIRGNILSIEDKLNEGSSSIGNVNAKIFNTYRVKKDNEDNSIVVETKRDEILTDYDVYWSIVKDCRNNCGYKAMLPNAMRNILEFYFGFIKEEDNLNNALLDIVDRKFVRFIQRNSHSDRENFTFNVEEIDVDSFINCFEDIFKKTRQYNHFKLKMK